MAKQISGGWKRKAFFYDLPSPLHVADPRHQQLGHEAGPGEYAHAAPPYPGTMPQGREDFGSADVLDTGGMQLDTTSAHDHTTGAEWGVSYTRVPDLDIPGAADEDQLRRTHTIHGRDQGASRKQNYSEKVLGFSDERYLSFRIPGLSANATDAIPPEAGGGGRGLTGQSVNNPPLESYLGHGFWPGTTEQLTVDRKLQARIIMRNDERAYTLNVPYFESDSPPPRPGNVSVTPFSALQRMVSGVRKIALQRQTPTVPGDVESEMAMADTESPPIEVGFYG
jgi:hypothetical protein